MATANKKYYYNVKNRSATTVLYKIPESPRIETVFSDARDRKIIGYRSDLAKIELLTRIGVFKLIFREVDYLNVRFFRVAVYVDICFFLVSYVDYKLFCIRGNIVRFKIQPFFIDFIFCAEKIDIFFFGSRTADRKQNESGYYKQGGNNKKYDR